MVILPWFIPLFANMLKRIRNSMMNFSLQSDRKRSLCVHDSVTRRWQTVSHASAGCIRGGHDGRGGTMSDFCPKNRPPGGGAHPSESSLKHLALKQVLQPPYSLLLWRPFEFQLTIEPCALF